MVGNNSSESLLPGLEAFDEEFGPEPTAFCTMNDPESGGSQDLSGPC
jgi:hypothetical protein